MQFEKTSPVFNTLIKYSFFLLFLLIPLLLTPWNYELFEYNKMMAVYALCAVISASWIAKMASVKQIRVKRTILDVPILLFAASQLISTLFSIDPHVSWLGYYSRFNGGMWSVLCYTVLYFAFTTHAELFIPKQLQSKPTKAKQPPAQIKLSLPPLIIATLASAGIVAIYGVLERMGIDKDIWVQDVQNRVFSTLGQPNWLAAYIVALLPSSIALLVSSKKPWSIGKIIWSITSVLLFCVLLFTRSRSGIVGFAIADVIWCACLLLPIWKDQSERMTRLMPIGILHIALAIIVFVNGTGTPTVDKYVTFKGIAHTLTSTKNNATSEVTNTPAGPALEVGGTESTVIRKFVWHAAVNAWKSSPKTMLVGTGTETFAFAFYQHRPAGHNLTSEWDFLYNKAHNEYLNYLATTGVVGLAAYMLFIGVFIWWFIKASLHTSLTTTKDHTYILASALFAGWISLLVTNFFGFSVVIGQIFFFLFPAFCILLLEKESTTKDLVIDVHDTPAFLTFLPVTVQTKGSTIVRALAIALGVYGVAIVGVYWYADTLYAQGYHFGRSGQSAQAVQLISQAISLNPHEPIYHDELSGNYGAISLAAFQNKLATQSAQFSELALKESNIALAMSPKNVNFWKTRTKIFYTLSTIDPALNESAIEALKQAILLSPNDPKIYYNLAILTGRAGNPDLAVSYLLQAKVLKKNYRDVYFALHVFYTEMKKPVEAKVILQEYVTNVDPKDKDFQDRISKL